MVLISNQHAVVEDLSEPDLSDDDMGMGLNLESPEEIQRIQNDAIAADGNPEHAGADAPAAQQPRKRKRNVSSSVWKHFKRGEEEPDGSYTATCLYCGTVYPMGNQRSTSSMKHHVAKGCKQMPSSKRHKPDALQRLLQAGCTNEQQPSLAAWEFDQARSRKNFAKCVIAHDYPFNCARHHFLKVFLSDLQPCFKLPSRTTIRFDCLKVYEEERSSLYGLFDKLDCKFAFTSDLWTSKSRDRGFMSITCHYIDDSWVLRKRIINFVALPSPHTGKNISQAIYEKLVMWNLDKRIFSLVLDNAASNDVCIKELLTTTPIKDVLPANGALFHQRCACHILNLIVHDGLNVLSGEITKVRDTMIYLRHSQSRMEKFRLAATQANAPPNKKPAWDVQTRWNSTYLMLELALEFKGAINRYATMDKKYTMCPTEHDWKNVEALVGSLKVFYVATDKFSGSKYATINIFFPEFCEVYLNIKKMESSPYSFIVAMGKEMFNKWDKYWTNGNAILAIACVLDPRCKFDVVEYYYKMIDPEGTSSFMDNLKACLSALFKQYMEASSKADPNLASSSAQHRGSSSSSSVISDTRIGLKNFLSSKKNSAPMRSELEDYLSDGLDETSLDVDFDILAWWKLKAAKYPILARLTRDVLAVPASTVASESAFSTAGRTLSPVRSSLNDKSLEALICSQDWLRASVLENGGVFGDVLWSSGEGEQDDTICGSAV